MKYAEKLRTYAGSNGFYRSGSMDAPYCAFDIQQGGQDTIKEIGDDYIIIQAGIYKKTYIVPLTLFVLGQVPQN